MSASFNRVVERGAFFLKALWSHANDRVLNVRTVPRSFSTARIDLTFYLSEDDSLHSMYSDYDNYQSPDYTVVWRVLKHLRPTHDDVIYDIGSGMGRILCVCARHPVKRCVGIEFCKPLCEIARQNAASLRGRKAPIDILCQDAANADLSDGTVYFLFNPFGKKTLRAVIDNIKTSVDADGRTIRIVYCNDRYVQVLEDCLWLEKYDTMWDRPGKRTSFWRSRCHG